MEEFTALEGQNIIDVTVQKYGTIAELFTLLGDNAKTLDTALAAGDLLLIRSTGGNVAIRTFMTSKGINVATTDTPPVEATPTRIFTDDFDNDFE